MLPEFSLDAVRSSLAKADANPKPKWGSMSYEQMLDHLRMAAILSTKGLPTEITTPEEKLPSYLRFLHSDKPFQPNLAKPPIFDQIEAKPLPRAQAEEALLESIEAYFEHYAQNPSFTAIHPNFGRLDFHGWQAMHRKHFSHHFTQFGLL